MYDDGIQYFAMRKVYLSSSIFQLRMGQSSDKLSATSSTSFCILKLALNAEWLENQCEKRKKPYLAGHESAADRNREVVGFARLAA